MFVSLCGHLWYRWRRFDCILLVFIRRWGRLVTLPFLSNILRCDWLIFSRCDWCISILAVSVCCSFGGPLSYGSPLVVFLDRGYPCFRNFYSTIPVDVVKVKSYVNRLFDPACVPMSITINNCTSFPSGLCPVLLACSETAEVWVRTSRMSRSCSLILSCIWSSGQRTWARHPPFHNSLCISKTERIKSSNFTVVLLFVPLKKCQNIGFPKQAVDSFTRTGPWFPLAPQIVTFDWELTLTILEANPWYQVNHQ